MIKILRKLVPPVGDFFLNLYLLLHLQKKEENKPVLEHGQPIKTITDTTNSKVEENEFEVFGKPVGLQLKSFPLLLILEVQKHIQLYI